MDQKKIGRFLKELRKEKELTQLLKRASQTKRYHTGRTCRTIKCLRKDSIKMGDRE